MILPTKYISQKQSLLGVGSVILARINNPISISTLWDMVKDDESIGSFGKFILTVDMLFIIGALDFSGTKLRKVKK